MISASSYLHGPNWLIACRGTYHIARCSSAFLATLPDDGVY